MHQQDIIEINKGLQSAYIDSAVNSNLAYRPQFITNDHKRGIKILTYIENQLMHCDEFSISVAQAEVKKQYVIRDNQLSVKAKICHE